MKKEFVLIIVSLFLLIACGEQAPTTTAEKTFIGGTTGLLVEFIEGEPPAEVTDGGVTPFTVTVKLENKGEAFVAGENVSFALKGFYASDFGVNTSDLVMISEEDVLKNEINPDTGEAINSPPVYVTFPSQFNFLGELSGNQVFPFVVDVCYQYKTIANTELCIKENLLDRTNNEICEVSGVKNVENSGGPIQITRFEEYTSGKDAVSFTLNVKNMGNGLFSQVGSLCNQTPIYKNIVKLSVDTGLDGLICSGLEDSGSLSTGEIKLSTGERQVRCTQNLAEKNDMIKIIEVTAEYDYQDSKSTNVLVKHLV